MGSGRYPISLAAFWISVRRLWDILGLSLSASDTVTCETPSSRAIDLKVVGRFEEEVINRLFVVEETHSVNLCFHVNWK